MKNLLLFICLSFSLNLVAQQIKKETSAKNSEIYIEAYWKKDLEKMKTYLNKESRFIDETAILAFGMKMPVSGEDMIKNFQQVFGLVENVQIMNVRSFHSGNHSVFNYNVSYWIQGNNVKNQVISIIKMKDGKLLEHREYADY